MDLKRAAGPRGVKRDVDLKGDLLGDVEEGEAVDDKVRVSGEVVAWQAIVCRW